VLNDFIHPAVDKIKPARAGEFPTQASSAASRDHHHTGLTRKPQDFGKLSSVPGSTTSFGCTPAIASAAVADRAYSFPAKRNDFVAQRECQAARFGFGCGIHRRRLVTLRDFQRFGRVRHVFTWFSPHRRGVGKLLWDSIAGADRTRSALAASRQIGFRKHFGHHFLFVFAHAMFAVIEPPAAMHNSRIWR